MRSARQGPDAAALIDKGVERNDTLDCAGAPQPQWRLRESEVAATRQRRGPTASSGAMPRPGALRQVSPVQCAATDFAASSVSLAQPDALRLGSPGQCDAAISTASSGSWRWGARSLPSAERHVEAGDLRTVRRHGFRRLVCRLYAVRDGEAGEIWAVRRHGLIGRLAVAAGDWAVRSHGRRRDRRGRRGRCVVAVAAVAAAWAAGRAWPAA